MLHTYSVKFERINFGFTPPLKQSADVVFQCEHENTEANECKIIGNARDAMWKQNPHWGDPSAPLEGYSGWSSVLNKWDITEHTDEGLDFDLGEPGEGKPRIAEIFYRKDDPSRTYRVTGFHKNFVPKPSKNKTPGEQIASDVIDKILAEEDAALSDDERARKARNIRVVSCSREEAEYVEGAGLAGCIARLEDIVITGRVKWEDRTIAMARRDYHFDAEWPNTMSKYWEMDHYLAKLAKLEEKES